MRVAKTKELIDELRERNMTRNDMGEFMQFSPSGVRKYLADLRAAHIVEVIDEHDPVTGQELYALIDNADQVQAFIDSLEAIARPCAGGGAPTQLQMALRDKSRTFHLMQDDAFYSVRIRRGAIAPDPHALPADFLRPAAVKADPLPPRAKVAQAAPVGFPVPSSYKFELAVQP